MFGKDTARLFSKELRRMFGKQVDLSHLNKDARVVTADSFAAFLAEIGKAEI